MLACLRSVEIGITKRHIHRSDHQAFIQITGDIHALAAADTFRFQRDIAPRHIRRGAKHCHFVSHGQVKKRLGRSLHLGDQARINPMPGDDQKADIIDGAPNFSGQMLFR